MSKELFERLMSMPADDIITELKDSDDKSFQDEEFDKPLSSHEATLLFHKNGVLSLEELNILMMKKIDEMVHE